jgi:DNA-binding response OmpR family regulator
MSERQAAAILVVEDSPRNLALVQAILARRPYRVAVATTLAEARSQVSDSAPDLILLDIRLPDGNGLDLVRELRANPARQGIKVLAVSASVLPADRTAVVAAGCDSFIAKPLHPAELLAEIDVFLAAG